MSVKEKRLIELFLTLFVVSLTAIILIAIFKDFKKLPILGGNYKEGIVSTAKNITPTTAKTLAEKDAVYLIFSSLFKRDENQKLVPDLIEKYSISEDKKIYTINIKQNILFHDGSPLKSEDVKVTLTAMIATRGQFANAFKDALVTTPNDYGITITLKKPNPDLLENLTFGIMPAKADPTKIVGSGPYMFESATRDTRGQIKQINLKINPNYYQKNSFLQNITLVLYPSLQAEIEGLRNKDIDSAAFLPVEYVEDLKKSPIISEYPIRLPIDVGLFFNLNKVGNLSSINVRRALNLAIDQREILKTLKLEKYPQQSYIILNKIPDSKDIALAAKILENNGWEISKDGIREKIKIVRRKKEVTKLVVTITTSDDQNYMDVAAVIQKTWREIGVDTKIRMIPKENIRKSVIATKDFEALIFGVEIGVTNDLAPFWHSSQISASGLNIAGYSTKEMDRLLDELSDTENDQASSATWQKIQKVLDRDVPAIFLYNPLEWYSVSKGIYGVQPLNIKVPEERFNQISNWYAKTGFGWK